MSLILGHLVEPRKGRVKRGIGRLLRWPAKPACEAFLAGATNLIRPPKGPLVTLPSSTVHTLAILPTAGGKDQSLIIPWLLTNPDCAVVLDVKGDLFKATAAARRAMGHTVVNLDPFGATGFKSDTYNPLDQIKKSSPTALDDCYALANAAVVRPPVEDKNKHFSDCAEEEIAGLCAFNVWYATPDMRSLQAVDQVATNKQLREAAIKAMHDHDEAGEIPFNGMLPRMAGRMEMYGAEEAGSVQSTVARNLRFLRSPMIDAITRTSSFDPLGLKKGKMTVNVCLPPQYLKSHSGWLRMILTSLMRVIVSNGVDGRLVHFILNEMASLQRLDILDDAIDKFRAYGIRIQGYLQSAGQLKALFPTDEGQTLMSNCVKIYASISDLDTAKQCSEMLGHATIAVEGGGRNWGKSNSIQNTDTNGSRSWSGGGSSDWKQQGRELHRPEELMTLDPRIAITFIPGIAPVKTWLIRAYEEKWLRQGWLKRQWEAMSMLVTALVYLFSMLFLALVLTGFASHIHMFERFERMVAAKGGRR